METASQPDLTFRIHHAALPVADLDRALAFYCGLLGMSLANRRRDAARGTEVGHVGYGGDESPAGLELIAGMQVRPGSGHLAIQVSDLRTLGARLEAAGVIFIERVRPGRPDGRNAFIAYVRDPDGHEIELIERR